MDWYYNPKDTEPTPLPAVTVEQKQERAIDYQQFRTQLKSIDRSQLDVLQRINYDILELVLDDHLAHFEAQTYLMPTNSETFLATYKTISNQYFGNFSSPLSMKTLSGKKGEASPPPLMISRTMVELMCE